MRRLFLAWLVLASLDAQTKVRQFEEVAISPDGNRIAWVEKASESAEGSAIFVLEWRAAAAAPRRITAGGPRETNLAWAPDSRRLAFLSNAESKKQPQVYVAPLAGTPRKLTGLTGFLTRPRWSPDGARLAVLFAENAPSGGGPLEAIPAPTGVIEEQVFNQRLATVESASGKVRQVSPPELHVYDYDWSPDGRSFAAIAAPGPGDNNWWIAQLYTVAIDSGKAQSIYRPSLQLAIPRWSPDGGVISFIEGIMSDEGFHGGDLRTIPAAGGEARNHTAGRKSSPNWMTWLSPGKILLTEHVDGGSAISTLELAGGRIETIWKGDEDLHAGGHRANFALARDGETSAVVRQSWQLAPEVWAGTAGQWRQLTHFNRARKPASGKAVSLQWSNEGHQIQGWLLYPSDFAPGRRYPMVVSVHGGPSNVKKPSWPVEGFDLSVLAGHGFFVFFPNPRGSYGRGEDFTRANVKDIGGGDLRDILAGVDHVLRSTPVDEQRLGIGGWSYGGYMTMWAVTQTNRFRAAVAGAGIANWESYYGQNSIDQWMLPFFGKSVYDDPAVYAKSSPIRFIKQVKTPTLVVVGERDGECPPAQSFEFWHALKTLGVSTQLVVYPGEGHAFRSVEHQRDLMRRTVGWLEQNLKREEGR
ncbi:MAG: S9 family peptidase [Acidobacteria bacterium]|nr:S9 family peptidase [Acidobacteriota bacterium]